MIRLFLIVAAMASAVACSTVPRGSPSRHAAAPREEPSPHSTKENQVAEVEESPVADVEASPAATEERTVVLRDGRVRATIPRSWVQLVDGSEGKVAVFQIRNPADEGTPDAANVGLLVPPMWGSVQAAARDSLRLLEARGGVVVSDQQGPNRKRVILARGQLERTPYVVMVVIGEAGDLVVAGHASYPLLERTTSDWHDAMLRDYKALLSSVRVDGVPVFPGEDPTSTVED